MELQPEIRPIVNSSAPSPGGQFARTSYEHHPNPAAPSIAIGAPAPSAAQVAADAAARERDERPSSTAPPKRLREWEDESHMAAQKKASTDESRSRLDEIKLHRPSPPQKMATPPNRSPSELRRIDEPRPTSAYHPSEAAHHPPSLPSMQHLTQPSPRGSAAPQEEYRAPPPAPQPAPVYEPAARKMDVDENYDDSGDDDKRSATKQESQRSSPKPLNGGAPAMSATGALEQSV